MLFSEIVGQDYIKQHLTKSADAGRIPHAQLFIGAEGTGTLAMAIAYSQYILCQNTNGENHTQNETCNLKFEHFSHPDIHFVYPVATNDEVKAHPVSANFLGQWRSFLNQNSYGSLYDWYQHIGIEKKQGQIGVDEAQEIMKALALKSYEGGYKIMIIWMADKMNTSAANKLLKLLEEPPAQTIFILITENKKDILQTILSRCQLIEFGGLSEHSIATKLQEKYNLAEKEALKIAHQAQGNYNRALQLMNQTDSEHPFEEWFVTWVRAAFKARNNASVIRDILQWSDTLAALGRETQKQFLNYCIDVFRQAFLLNYKAEKLVFFEPTIENFTLEKFAPFVHSKNIHAIFSELSDAIYHIERNGNAKVILTDMSIKLTRLIHTKE